MGYIPPEEIDKLKDSLDIVDIVSEYLELKRTGASYKGLCPFHNEKTPSFNVSRERGSFHCFGCGESGDLITFIMKMENLNYPEAVRFLADKEGIILTERKTDRKKAERREKLLKINELVMKFYYKSFLLDRRAQHYLIQRGFGKSIMNEFLIGYADRSNDSLYQYLLSQKVDLQDMIDLGFVAKSRNSEDYYDKFRDRLMFPIINNRKQVIGFGGRTISNHKIKYINSPETDVFIKGNNLYGINNIQKNRTRDHIILVEGYMDVIGLHNQGIRSSVASLGTALTENQAQLVDRYGEKIYIAYDSDEAGLKASLRAIEVFDSIDVAVNIIRLPAGMDPDDFVKKYGKHEFLKLMRNAPDSIDFQLDLILKKGLDHRNLLEEVVDYLAKIEKNTLRDVYINKMSEKLNLFRDSLYQDVEKKRLEKQDKEEKKLAFKRRKSTSPPEYYGDEDFILPDEAYYHNIPEEISYYNPVYNKGKHKDSANKEENHRYILEKEMIEKILFNRESFLILAELEDFISKEKFKKMYRWAETEYKSQDTLSVKEYLSFCERHLDKDEAEFFEKEISIKSIGNDNYSIAEELKNRIIHYKNLQRKDEILKLLQTGDESIDRSALTLELTEILQSLTQ